MNLLLIAVILILLFGAATGYRKGLVKMVFGLISMILALVIASSFGPKIGATIQKNEKVMEVLTGGVRKTFQLDELVKKVPKGSDLVDGIELPEALKGIFDVSSALEQSGVDDFAQNAAEKGAEFISESLAKTIINVLCFLGVFVVALLLLGIVSRILNGIVKLPLLNLANRLGGLGLGLIIAVLAVWVLFAIITACGSTEFGKMMFAYINDSKFLTFVYDTNIPMKLIASAIAEAGIG